MPINLTEPEGGYTQVTIVMQRIDFQRSQLFITFLHGNTVDSVFVPGRMVGEERIIRNREQILDGQGGELEVAIPAFDDLFADSVSVAEDESAPADGGHRVYVAMDRTLLEYAITQGWYAGTVA